MAGVQTSYLEQPWYPRAAELADGDHVVYLATWERALSTLDYDRGRHSAEPHAIRDVALGGPDSTARAQQIWQVRAAPVQVSFDPAGKPLPGPWVEWLETVRPRARGLLKAKAAEPPAAGGPPCDVSPRARFRGDENKHYRVEIRRGGTAADDQPTFVFSCDNGSVAFAVDKIVGAEVTLAGGWRDSRFAIAPGDVVEVAGADASSSGRPRRCTASRITMRTATRSSSTASRTPIRRSGRPVLLRRWDHGPAARSTAARNLR